MLVGWVLIYFLAGWLYMRFKKTIAHLNLLQAAILSHVYCVCVCVFYCAQLKTLSKVHLDHFVYNYSLSLSKTLISLSFLSFHLFFVESLLLVDVKKVSFFKGQIFAPKNNQSLQIVPLLYRITIKFQFEKNLTRLELG